jgi:hypothetical protein
MNFYKLFLFLFVFIFGCSHTPVKKTHNYNYQFEQLDLNKDGNISEVEFNELGGKITTNYADPAIAFIIIMLILGVLILLPNILNIKNKKKHVRD